MIKVRNKKFSLLMAIVFAFTVMAPFGGIASAATGFDTLTAPTVDDNGVFELGRFEGVFAPGQLKVGDSVTFRLPNDFKFLKDTATDANDVMDASDWSVSGNVYGQSGGNYFEFPGTYLGNANGLKASDVSVEKLDDDEIKLTINSITDSGEYAYFTFNLGSIWVDEGFEGDIEVSATAPNNSGFASGNILVGRVSGGEVDLEVINAPNFNNDTTGDSIKIRIKEDRAGAIADGESSAIKLVLPDGFEWKNYSGKAVWGNDIFAGEGDTNGDKAVFVLNDAKDELKIDTSNYDGTDEPTLLEITVDIECVDETDAEHGDVVVKVKGESKTSDSELVVARYGDYDATISTGDVPTIYAGQLEQEIAKIKIEESIAGSLIADRTLLLTLPDEAKWGKLDDDSDHGLYIDPVGFPGRDGQTAKFEFTGGSSSDAAELELKEMEVMVEPGFEGDLVVEVSGSAGLSGELVVAKVVPAVKVTADVVDGLVIGRSAQDAGNITITEADAGLIIDGKDLVIDLPGGVRFASVPDVEVTAGDLEIDDFDVKDDTDDEDNLLVISIKDDSNEASTIEISGIEYVLDRTVPEGDIKVVVRGDAVNEVNDATAVNKEFSFDSSDKYVIIETYEAFDVEENTSDDDYHKIFPKQDEAAVVVNAEVGTPAPEETKLTTSITLGENGSYISDGRIMVQLRDAATALGVAEQNIFWDNATKSATFIKGDRVVQITVGDPQVKLNGVALPTDKGAEIKDGRTYVSLSAAGVALGATASWDNTTKTATLTVQ